MPPTTQPLTASTDSKGDAAQAKIATPVAAVAPVPPAGDQVGALATTADPRSIRSVAARRDGPSPLQKLRRHARAENDDPETVTIFFLTGPFKGKSLKIGRDLGLISTDVSDETGAEWTSRDNTNIRPGSTFSKLKDQTFTVATVMWDHGEDIAHLTENLKNMLVVGSDSGGEKAGTAIPSLLYLRIGSIKAKPVFCTTISTKYSEPFAGERGHRQAEITMSFTLQGGVDSENADGYPLTSTPLTDYLNSTTDDQRRKQGVQAIAKELFAPCLGEVGGRQVQDLIQNDKLSNKAAILALDNNTLVQSAVGGYIPPDVLQDPQVREKLRLALAESMAASENGVGGVGGRSTRAFAQSLLTGDFSRLPPNLVKQAEVARAAYEVMFAEISKGGVLKEDSSIFTDAALRRRLKDFGSCGLQMRSVRSDLVQADGTEDAATLKVINEYLAGKPSDQEVRDRFGLSTESQVRLLKNGVPYGSKNEFILHAARRGASLPGHVIWANYVKFVKKPAPETVPPGSAPTTTPAF